MYILKIHIYSCKNFQKNSSLLDLAFHFKSLTILKKKPNKIERTEPNKCSVHMYCMCVHMISLPTLKTALTHIEKLGARWKLRRCCQFWCNYFHCQKAEKTCSRFFYTALIHTHIKVSHPHPCHTNLNDLIVDKMSHTINLLFKFLFF